MTVQIVLDVLLPILNEMKQDLNHLTTTVSNLGENDNNLEENVSILENTVEEHKTQTISEHHTSIENPSINMISLAVVKRLQPYLNILENSLERIDESTESLTRDLSSVNAIVTDLKEKVCSVNDSQTETLDMIDLKLDSVSDILNSDTELESSNTMKMMSVNSEFEENVIEELQKTYDLVEAHANRYTCGGEGDWRRVVYLNMTDPDTDCPTGWREITSPKRRCGKVTTDDVYLNCDSVFFPVTGGHYTRVCGRIIAYQHSWPDAFEAYYKKEATTIDGPYVGGISLTRGTPREHIWTFAAGATEDSAIIWPENCPCDSTYNNLVIPPFVGEDYFCESGIDSGAPSLDVFYADDPLWDGEGCTNTSTCCELNNPPYFTKQLARYTSDPIEARICQWGPKDDSPVEFMELYVQ